MSTENKPGPPSGIPTLSYALFYCDPSQEPPFDLELGFSDVSFEKIENCAHIPDALEKLEALCAKRNISKSAHFTLLYPIYLEAMGTDAEDAMHQIAWLIKEEADNHKWNFARVDGYTGKSQMDFI